MNDKVLSDFFREVYKGITKFGALNVLRKLQQLEVETYSEKEKELMDFIILKVINSYQITRIDLMKSPKRGDITDARKMCFVLFKRHLKLSDYQIARYFDRVRQVVHRAMNEYETMSANIAHEKRFLEILAVIDDDCCNFKQLQEKSSLIKNTGRRNNGNILSIN
jgi:chromosomal replication initiation ATPase DnaA